MKIWRWLKANLGAVITTLVAALGAGILWSYHRGKIRSLQDQAAIENAHRKVAALDARRNELAELAEENKSEIEVVEKQRRDIQRSAVSIEHEIAEMSDDEIESAFRDLY